MRTLFEGFVCDSCGKRFTTREAVGKHAKESCHQSVIPPIAGSVRAGLRTGLQYGTEHSGGPGQSSSSLRKSSKSSLRPKIRTDPYMRTTLPSASLQRDHSSSLAPALVPLPPPVEISRDASSHRPQYVRGRPRNKWIPQSLLYFSNSSKLASISPFYQSEEEESLKSRVTMPTPPCFPGTFTPIGVSDIMAPALQPGGGVTPMPRMSPSRALLTAAPETVIPMAGPSGKTENLDNCRPFPAYIDFSDSTSSPVGSSSSAQWNAGISQTPASQDAFDMSKIWYEERDSRRACELYPYHPNLWNGVLPGPDLTNVPD